MERRFNIFQINNEIASNSACHFGSNQCHHHGDIKCHGPLYSNPRKDGQLKSYSIIYHNITGWCLGHPSEKYESQLGWLFPIYGKIKKWQPNHQPDNINNIHKILQISFLSVSLLGDHTYISLPLCPCAPADTRGHRETSLGSKAGEQCTAMLLWRFSKRWNFLGQQPWQPRQNVCQRLTDHGELGKSMEIIYIYIFIYIHIHTYIYIYIHICIYIYICYKSYFTYVFFFGMYGWLWMTWWPSQDALANGQRKGLQRISND